MSSFRRLKAWALHHELNPDHIRQQLADAHVPVSDAACRTCAEPCEDGHDAYPPRFKVDMETQMLGSVRPFRRQIMVSTGATDWDRDVTSTRGSLAAYISAAASHYTGKTLTNHHNDSAAARIPGIFNATESSEITILNGNHATISEDGELGTVLVFPDYVVVAGVPSTSAGAKLLWEHTLDPTIPRAVGSENPEPSMKTWVLPYACVITMCSHKRRDNRCGIAAPKLEHAFSSALTHRGWTVDTHLDGAHFMDEPPLEKLPGTQDERAAHVVDALENLQDTKRALILYNSHMGGHRYSGNCIIYLPTGASIWYGRLTPHDVDAVVQQTIEEGLILPNLLRGGMGLTKTGGKEGSCSLHDW